MIDRSYLDSGSTLNLRSNTTGTSIELFLKNITPMPTRVFIFGSHALKEVRKTARCHISLLKPKGEQFADKPTA
jgi:hypothetical protein